MSVSWTPENGIPQSPAADAVNTPLTLATMNVDESLRLKALNKKLEMESLLDDIFEDLGSDVVASGQQISVPNAIFMKLEAVPTGARQVTIPMLMALQGNPSIGPGTPIGKEHTQQLKYATFFYNEYSYAVASTAWGVNYNDMSVYGVFEHIQPQISLYMKEFRGLRIREALLYTHDSVITTNNAFNGANNPFTRKALNKNWFISGVDIADQPGMKYDPHTQSFADIVGTALTDIDAGTPVDAKKHNISLNNLLSLEYFAKNYLRIEPVSMDGKDTYVVLIPSSQAAILKTNESGKLGEIYTAMVRKDADVMEYTGAFGRVGSLLLVEDQRYPTLDATPNGVSGEFLYPGNEDARTKAPTTGGIGVNKKLDCGFLLGKAAVCEWTVRELHFETETQNYGYNKGTGAFGESGISIVEYDTNVGWDATASNPNYKERENTGSIVLAWTIPAITTA